MSHWGWLGAAFFSLDFKVHLRTVSWFLKICYFLLSFSKVILHCMIVQSLEVWTLWRCFFMCAKMGKGWLWNDPSLCKMWLVTQTLWIFWLTMHRPTKTERINGAPGGCLCRQKETSLGLWSTGKRLDMRYSDRTNIISKPVPQTLIMASRLRQGGEQCRRAEGLIADPDEMRMQALLIRNAFFRFFSSWHLLLH